MTGSVSSIDLPVRVISLMRNSGVQVAGYSFSDKGASSLQWTISDLLLYAPVGEGEGLQNHEPALAAYCGGYVDMLKSLRGQINNVSFAGAQLAPGVFNWPQGSEDQFFGIEAVLTVKELM